MRSVCFSRQWHTPRDHAAGWARRRERRFRASAKLTKAPVLPIWVRVVCEGYVVIDAMSKQLLHVSQCDKRVATKRRTERMRTT
jgi:hypothetical protein